MNLKEKARRFSRMIGDKFRDQFGFRMIDFSFANLVRYFHEPKDASSLAVIRILFGFCMLFDIAGERGGSNMNALWGKPNVCHFPLFPFLTALPLPHMAFVYVAMWSGALGIMLGYEYHISSILFTACHWYLLLIEKSFWNNHSYLFGVVGLLMTFTQANCYWSIDAYLNPSLRSDTVPYWNYFIVKYQFFILYFVAGLKKGTAEWLTGYSVQKLARHWVFDPFKLLLTEQQIDYLIVHWFIFLFDLTVAFWLMWERSRPIATVFCALFHLMNSQLFLIGMFPWVCLSTLPIFYPFDWPKTVLRFMSRKWNYYIYEIEDIPCDINARDANQRNIDGDDVVDTESNMLVLIDEPVDTQVNPPDNESPIDRRNEPLTVSREDADKRESPEDIVGHSGEKLNENHPKDSQVDQNAKPRDDDDNDSKAAMDIINDFYESAEIVKSEKGVKFIRTDSGHSQARSENRDSIDSETDSSPNSDEDKSKNSLDSENTSDISEENDSDSKAAIEESSAVTEMINSFLDGTNLTDRELFEQYPRRDSDNDMPALIDNDDNVLVNPPDNVKAVDNENDALSNSQKDEIDCTTSEESYRANPEYVRIPNNPNSAINENSKAIVDIIQAFVVRVAEAEHDVVEKSTCINVGTRKKLTTVAILFFVFLQAFLPYSHFITKGFNNWTNGLYGYSWDMMVHTWEYSSLAIEVVDNDDQGNSHFLDPSAYTVNDRWSRHGDMVYQYAHCLKRMIRENEDVNAPKFSNNISIYMDIWYSLNGRFTQRMFDPKADILASSWSLLKPVPFLMPLLDESLHWRSVMDDIRDEVHSWGKHSDVLFYADFPGYDHEKYISNQLGNVTLTVLQGDVGVDKDIGEIGQSFPLKGGSREAITPGTFHTVRNIGSRPVFYQYTYINITEMNLDAVSVKPWSAAVIFQNLRKFFYFIINI